MKKLVFILFFICLMTGESGAVPVIESEFYLNNEMLYDSDAVRVTNILPSTLRLTLSEGESCEIYADVIPENAQHELVWSLPEELGTINIYPRGEYCTVYGAKEGTENIKIDTENGKASATVSVEVKKQQEIRTRSFEYDIAEEEGSEIFTSAVMQFIIRFLLTLAFSALLAAVWMLVRQRGKKRK
ncbi:MAG: hypothetical protein II996_07290 [Oscillospiraceae bacterium]|nr:hypothetical protein [Oscillospiraceae bacterium]